MLYVHLVPHSHDDLGWKKTVDGYYYGARQDIQNAYVEMTLDTAIQALLDNPKRKYTQVEMKFFSMWWQE
jgi:alpha-mannosidase